MIVTVTLNPSLDEWVRLPRLHVGELNRATRFLRYPGGKGINVARVVHELGGKTLAVALAGGDDGRILSGLLSRQGIPHRFVTVSGATRNNYQVQTDSPKALTQINCPGPPVSVTALHHLEQLLCQLGRTRPRASCVVLSGSLPPGAPSRTYQRMIRVLHRLRIPTVLDTSGPALRQGLAARPWLIKPNRHEAEALLKTPLRRRSEVIQAARRLVAHGPSLVIISLGPDGAVLASQTHAHVMWATPPAVSINSPVGAGDSLVAGFVLGYFSTQPLRARPALRFDRRAGEAFQLGVACGAACVMTPGTELCRRKDVQRLKPHVRIEVIP